MPEAQTNKACVAAFFRGVANVRSMAKREVARRGVDRRGVDRCGVRSRVVSKMVLVAFAGVITCGVGGVGGLSGCDVAREGNLSNSGAGGRGGGEDGAKVGAKVGDTEAMINERDAYRAFAPARVRIHPLTLVDAVASDTNETGAGSGAKDRAVLVLHYELRDRFGDSIKALGLLKVELYRPAPGVMGGVETREANWTVADTLEAEGNSTRFDRTTRTYRVQLFAPGWVRDWAAGDAAARSGTPWIKVRVVYETLDGDGKMRTITDEFVIQAK